MIVIIIMWMMVSSGIRVVDNVAWGVCEVGSGKNKCSVKWKVKSQLYVFILWLVRRKVRSVTPHLHTE